MAKQQEKWILGGSGNILGGNMGLGEEKGGIKDKGLKGSPIRVLPLAFWNLSTLQVQCG